MVEARDRIVQEARACLGGEATRLREEDDQARRRAAQVRGEIGGLGGVLKSLGSRADLPAYRRNWSDWSGKKSISSGR